VTKENSTGGREEGSNGSQELVPIVDQSQALATVADAAPQNPPHGGGGPPAARPLSYAPSIVFAAGETTAKRFLTFFTDSIRNKNTRRAYHRAVCEFFEWAQARGLAFAQIESVHVSLYIEECLGGLSKASVKQRLAAVRMLYDWLIRSGVVPELRGVNPAASVRGPKLVVKKGKTRLLSADETRHLLDSIPATEVVGLRDRALIALMTYTFARVGAAITMSVEDFYVQNRRGWVRLHEKGGKEIALPCHHNLEHYLADYIAAASLAEEPKTPLFRSAKGKTGQLTDKPMAQADVYQMIRRRRLKAGIGTQIGCHSFRATGITTYMQNGGKLEVAQEMAGHESARTTGLYNRVDDEVSLDEVERVRI